MVDRIIKNRVYMGWAYRGDQVNPDAHPPLVTPAEWHAANNAPVRSAPTGKKPNLLGGLVRCAGCRYLLAPGKAMWGGARGYQVLAYRCRTLHAAGKCTEPASVDAVKLERHVEGLWRQQMASEAFLVQPDNQALQAASEVLQATERELAVFAGDTTARKLLGQGYHDALATRAQAVEEARAGLQGATASTPAGLADVASYDDLGVADRKRLLGASIDTIIVHRGHSRTPIEDRVTVLWRGEGPDDLPRRGRDNGPIRPYTP